MIHAKNCFVNSTAYKRISALALLEARKLQPDDLLHLLPRSSPVLIGQKLVTT